MAVPTAYSTAPNFRHTWRWVSISAIAFGFLEAIVVIYIRLLYFPEGFSFPLTLAPTEVYLVELTREICTMLMLAATGMLAGKNTIQRFAWFLYAFAVWDICYYLALKIFIDWPPSLVTWDILFLIPVVWDGPVLAPLICSITMIGFAAVVLETERKGRTRMIRNSEWLMMSTGAFLVFYTFIRDYSAILISAGFFSGIHLAGIVLVMEETLNFIPEKFSWTLFGIGEMLIITPVFVFGRRNLSAIRGSDNKDVVKGG
jgi:hypothetical protein